MTTAVERIRPARPDDAETLLALIGALAEYERLPPPAADARERLREDGFGARRRFEVLLAEAGAPPAAVGYALFFETYSSFLALPTLFLEDLFVLPSARGGGHGRALFRAVAREARERGCGRMEWSVLGWNRLAREFYDRQGAVPLEEWQPYRLEGDALARVAAG